MFVVFLTSCLCTTRVKGQSDTIHSLYSCVAASGISSSSRARWSLTINSAELCNVSAEWVRRLAAWVDLRQINLVVARGEGGGSGAHVWRHVSFTYSRWPIIIITVYHFIRYVFRPLIIIIIVQPTFSIFC